MRTAFIKTLIELAEDNNTYLLTNDLGFSVLEGFAEKFPDKFFNMGVAEANIIGVAAGLALSGKKVYVYSITPFITMRCFEQIRNDLCMQNLDVKVIGIGAGLCYGSSGPTHHSIIDIAIMRALPNMTVICPGDPKETEGAVRYAHSHKGPVYLRLGKAKEPDVHNKPFDKSITLREGDVAVIATGNILATAKEVAERLNIGLISMPVIKPIDKEAILKLKTIYTIEEHSLIGGLGSAVAEIIAGKNISFKMFGIKDRFTKEAGSQEYLREKNGLTTEQIIKEINEG